MTQLHEQEQEREPADQPPGTGADHGEDVGMATERSSFVLPTLVGVAVIILNAVVISKEPWRLTASNLNSAMFVTLMGASILLGIFLIVYANWLRRSEGRFTDGRMWLTVVAFPLAAGTLAVVATFSSVSTVETLFERQLSNTPPCLQLYQKAAAIRDVSPNFRMPENDRDERRCKINQAVLR